jgi:O-acetyl-ADP-ribose deacetylase (regulator of RNase III)
VKLHLVDTNPALVSAWQSAFADLPEVSVQQAKILSLAHNAIVSPANSYGFMDGGIDLAYRRFCGKGLEARVQEAIARRPEGLLPVGASLIVSTGHERIRYLIVAPTMVIPEWVSSENCYRAMRALLRSAAGDLEVGKAVFCPGLGTGVGAVPVEDAAREMAKAYWDWKSDLGKQ